MGSNQESIIPLFPLKTESDHRHSWHLTILILTPLLALFLLRKTRRPVFPIFLCVIYGLTLPPLLLALLLRKTRRPVFLIFLCVIYGLTLPPLLLALLLLIDYLHRRLSTLGVVIRVEVPLVPLALPRPHEVPVEWIVLRMGGITPALSGELAQTQTSVLASGHQLHDRVVQLLQLVLLHLGGKGGGRWLMEPGPSQLQSSVMCRPLSEEERDGWLVLSASLSSSCDLRFEWSAS